MPIGILHLSPVKVNRKIEMCINTNSFDVDINDLLENIQKLSKYILSKNRYKVNKKKYFFIK